MTKSMSCPTCQSDNIYQYKQYFEYSGVGEELLPKLGDGAFGVAKIRPVVCADCGHVRLMASSETIGKMKVSEHWERQ